MPSLRHIFYKLFIKPVLKLYLKSDSTIKFDGFKLKIFKEVFHPKLFFSTKYFYEFIKKQPLKGLKFLELGSGSGILSLCAARQGAQVTAVDIDVKAVENTSLNFTLNFKDGLKTTVLQSDLFDNLTRQEFDMIVINPPYYFKKITTDLQYAWYCGENGEYFEKLFTSLADFMHANTLVYMILEENCEIERIKTMAAQHKILFQLVDEKKIRWEKSFIFRLTVK